MQAITETKQQAVTILSQINAADFFARARWGVKNMGHDAGTLVLYIPRRGRKAHQVQITLDAVNDTYTVRAGYLKNWNWTETANVEGVYCDNLVPVIDGILER